MAKEKIEKTPEVQMQSTSKTVTQYRDRALERCILFSQRDVPVLESVTTLSGGNRRAEGPPPASFPPPPPVAPGKDESNIWNKLLKLMGWKEGTGLGTEGEGRVDPMSIHSFLFSLGEVYVLIRHSSNS